jgi:hypothetical protein
MCHWNTVNWNCIIRKETLEEKISEEEKHALSRLQKELSEQKKVELLFTDADLEKDITFFLSGHHVKPEECMLLATEPEEVAWAKKDADSDSDQLTIIGYEVPDFSKQMPLSNVDMLLLQELRGDQCELEMISGGSYYAYRSYSDLRFSGELLGLKELLMSDEGQQAQLNMLAEDCEDYVETLWEVPDLDDTRCTIYAGMWCPTSETVVRNFLQRRQDRGYDLRDINVIYELFREQYAYAACCEEYEEGYANRADTTYEYVMNLEV